MHNILRCVYISVGVYKYGSYFHPPKCSSIQINRIEKKYKNPMKTPISSCICDNNSCVQLKYVTYNICVFITESCNNYSYSNCKLNK